MNNLEKLISNLSNYWDISPDKVVDRLNFMNEQEINKIVDKMTKKFKNGGMIDCLRNGGSVKDCGCGAKMVKKGAGGMETEGNDKKRRVDQNGYAYTLPDGTDVLTIDSVGTQGLAGSNYQIEGSSPGWKTMRTTLTNKGGDVEGYNYDVWLDDGDHFLFPYRKYTTKRMLLKPSTWLRRELEEGKARQYKAAYDANNLKNGGTISAQSGVKLRKDTIDNLVNMGGFTRQQARDAYRQQKQSVREQSGLYGAAMRQKARQNLNDAMALKSAPTLGLEDIVISDEPIVMEDVKFDFGEAPVIKKMSVPTNTNVYANTMSKDAAFADARRRGFKTFKWNGQEYNTLYAGEKPKSDPKTSISWGKPASGYLLANDITPYRGGYTTIDDGTVRAMAVNPSTMYPAVSIEPHVTNYVEAVPGSNTEKKYVLTNVPSKTPSESAWETAMRNGQLMTSTPLYTPPMDDPNIYQFGGGSKKATPATESRRGWLGRAIRAMWDPGKYAK